MPSVTENNGAVEAEEEDMEQLENEDRKSWEEETASGSAEGDDDHEEDEDEGGSSEMDEEECDRRKTECMDDLNELTHQFCKLKDQLFNEREAQIEHKLRELERETDPDYLTRLAELERSRIVRLQVAKIRDGLRREAIQEKFRSEELAAKQHMESEKELLYDHLKSELEEKIKRLEEDRHNIDITADLYESQNQKKRKKHDPFNCDRRKKPVQVSGPYIVYLLRDTEIIEDWTMIKRAMKQQAQRRKVDCL
ncbi:breast cancer metastasis-suppressor 1-like protein isoform X2 [Babylonia areolata]|uniref:breast cancer metastasis-suppressor 1-like protein isoform X1 n=1 Tax=Babylonia areolata TaxID=304850 RepID=UPI003FD2100C